MRKITVGQAGALGGKARWSKKTKKEKSDAMRLVALARYKKVEPLKTSNLFD